MREDYETKHHRLEKTHWFLSSRRHLLRKFTRSLVLCNAKILEVGCSTGVLLEELKHDGFKNVYGVDTSETAIVEALKKGTARVARTDGKILPFENDTFDIVISSDVIEHIERDAEALKEWKRVIKPGGLMLLLTPAFPFLWSEHDEINNHFRRYTKKSLFRIFNQAGFTKTKIRYWNFFLFAPIAIMRMLGHLKIRKMGHIPKDQLYEFPSLLNSAICFLMKMENMLMSSGVSFPFGVSLFAIARK